MDLTKLNRFVRRPAHPVRTPRDAVAEIDGSAKWFSALDASDGYFQIALQPSCQHLTTFATPWGRYRFLRAPQGLNCSGDEYNRRQDTAFAGQQQLVRVVDDLLSYHRTFADHVTGLCGVLTAARKARITEIDLLRVDLTEFAQWFDAPDQARAVVRVRASLLSALTRAPIAQQAFSSERPCATPDAPGAVSALIVASQQVVDDLLDWTARTLARG